MRRLRAVALAMIAVPWTGAPCQGSGMLSSRDRAAILALDTAYVNAWLRDDTAGVLATLAHAAVLMPGGLRPMAGDSAIRNFWWPKDGSRTRVLSYTTDVDEISGTSTLAYVRGRGTLTFSYEKDTIRLRQTNRNMTLTVVTKLPNGEWKILERMWANLAP